MTPDDREFTELYHRYYDQIEQICRSHLATFPQGQQEIDDCIQRTFFIAFQKYHQMMQCDEPYHWLSSVCRKECMNVVRKRLRRQRIIGPVVSLSDHPDAPAVEDILLRWLEKNDAQEVIQRIQAQLTPNEQRIYEDYFIQEKTVPAIARERAVTEGSVYGTIQRIRKKAHILHFFYILLIHTVWFRLLAQ